VCTDPPKKRKGWLWVRFLAIHKAFHRVQMPKKDEKLGLDALNVELQHVIRIGAFKSTVILRIYREKLGIVSILPYARDF
jgi:hypothetical protein